MMYSFDEDQVALMKRALCVLFALDREDREAAGALLIDMVDQEEAQARLSPPASENIPIV